MQIYSLLYITLIHIYLHVYTTTHTTLSTLHNLTPTPTTAYPCLQVTNCRYGMMLWQMLLFCYAFKQYDTYGYVASSMVVSIAIQTVYVFKFFLWETGYFCTMDIQVYMCV